MTLLPDSANYDLACQLQTCQPRSRRNGKVARLPFALREQINQLFDDGVPYKAIIQKLGEAGKHLTEHNLSNWRLGGYQDFLRAQAIHDRARIQTEAAADVVRQSGDLDPTRLQRTCKEKPRRHDTLLALHRRAEPQTPLINESDTKRHQATPDDTKRHLKSFFLHKTSPPLPTSLDR